MPLGLKRYQQARHLHFITFSCYKRQPKLGTGFRRFVFEEALEQARRKYGFFVTGYVVNDFNVWSERKRIEKLRYMHRNPVKRGLVTHPQDWLWSSFRHYATGVEGVVEIESQWTFSRKERMGITPRLRIVEVRKDPPKRSLGGAPSSAEKI